MRAWEAAEPGLFGGTGPAPGRRPGADRGSATVWGVGAIAVLCTVFGVALALGQVVVVRQHAARGADLAALAAADRWARGERAACEHAARVARAQAVRLVRCVLTGDLAEITAASDRGPFTAEARSRAGPAGTDPREPLWPPPGVAPGTTGPGADLGPGPR